MSEEQKVAVFLDIDGVLRRESSAKYKFEQNLLTFFERLLAEFADLDVIVSSSWREAFSLREIRQHFSTDFRKRVIGVTPILYEDRFTRYAEIRTFLSKRRYKNWIAIDDSPYLFPARLQDSRRQFGRLFITDSETGFDQSMLQQVCDYLHEYYIAENVQFEKIDDTSYQVLFQGTRVFVVSCHAGEYFAEFGSHIEQPVTRLALHKLQAIIRYSQSYLSDAN